VILFCADEFVGKAGETISQDVGVRQGKDKGVSTDYADYTD
jgi:hypothetical protein